MSRLCALIVAVACTWCAPALPCTFAGDDVFAIEVHEAPRGGAWWVRGTRTAGDSFVLVTVRSERDEEEVVVVPSVVSTGGLTTWALAVPDFPVGTVFRLRGFTPEGFDAPSDVVLTIVDGAADAVDEASLTIAQPRVTLARSLGSVESGFVLHNPMEIVDGSSCSSWPPLLWMGTTTGETTLDVAFTIDTPELVVLDVGRGDLDEPVAMQLNAFQADGDVRLRFSLADDRNDDVHVRLRSIATGVAGEQRIVPIPASGDEAPRFEMHVLGCAQSDAASWPLLSSLLILVRASRCRRRRPLRVPSPQRC